MGDNGTTFTFYILHPISVHAEGMPAAPRVISKVKLDGMGSLEQRQYCLIIVWEN